MTQTIVLREHFASIDEMLTAIATRPMAFTYSASRIESQRRTTWAGTPSLAAAMKMIRDGWQEGRDKAIDLRDRLVARTTLAMAPAYSMDVAGAYPIAALAAAGDPLSMVNPEPSELRQRPIIRLTVSVTASATYRAAEMTNYGACMAAIVDMLEASDYRVELSAAFSTISSDATRAYVGTVIVKESGEHVDADRLAFALTHPSMLRRLFFATHETHGEHSALFATTHGTPWNTDAVEIHLDAGSIYLPGANIIPPGSPMLASAVTAFPFVVSRISERLASHGVIMPPSWGAIREGSARDAA